MPNRHESKFLIYLFVGLIFTSSGIFSIIYACFNKSHEMDWLFWAAISAITLNAGLLVLGSAIVHKIKADFSKRQRSKDRADRRDQD